MKGGLTLGVESVVMSGGRLKLSDSMWPQSVEKDMATLSGFNLQTS